MTSKVRFQILLEPEQLEALRRVEERTGAAVGAQIRLAVDRWLQTKGGKTDRKRARTRKRP